MIWLDKITELLRNHSDSTSNLTPNTTNGFGGANMFNGQQPTNTFLQGLIRKPEPIKPNPWGYQPAPQMAQTSMMQHPQILDANNSIPQ